MYILIFCIGRSAVTARGHTRARCTRETSPMPTDPVIEFFRSAAEAEPAIKLLILFGSRARGNGCARSDYDWAVDAPGWTESGWAAWSLRVKDEAPTLCGIDLVWLRKSTSPALRGKIETEGKTVHERRKT